VPTFTELGLWRPWCLSLISLSEMKLRTPESDRRERLLMSGPIAHGRRVSGGLID